MKWWGKERRRERERERKSKREERVSRDHLTCCLHSIIIFHWQEKDDDDDDDGDGDHNHRKEPVISEWCRERKREREREEGASNSTNSLRQTWSQPDHRYSILSTGHFSPFSPLWPLVPDQMFLAPDLSLFFFLLPPSLLKLFFFLIVVFPSHVWKREEKNLLL